MLTAKNISVGYGGNAIINDVNLTLRKREKVALVGPNGSGKSTLLNALAGKLSPDSGSVINDGNMQIGYLPQMVEILSRETVLAYIKRATGIKKIEEQMELQAEKLTDPASLQEYGILQEQYVAIDGYTFGHRLMLVLRGLGLDEILLEQNISSLSGGQKSKVAIAALLLSKPDILLLDEPTNNLDLPSIVWLETFLTQTSKGCLIVSHDRNFLDHIVSKVIVVDPRSQTITEHTGSYTDYIERTENAKLRQAELYEIQQREVKQMKDTVDKKKRWANKGAKQQTSDNDKYLRGYQRDRSSGISRNAKALEKQIERMQKIEKPKEEKILTIPLNAMLDSAKHSIVVNNLIAGYKNGFQIGPITTQFTFGSKTAIIGSNGSGKTTLLRVIAGEMIPLSGTVSIGPSLVIGTITQELLNMPQGKTILNFIMDKSKAEKHLVYNILHRFGFSADNVGKEIRYLSPGERMRLLIALYSLLSVNTLILDEPTNHLDREAMTALEILLGQYEGTVVLVSHDRYFLKMFNPSQIFIVEHGNINVMKSYYEYLKGCYKEAQKLIQEFPENY